MFYSLKKQYLFLNNVSCKILFVIFLFLQMILYNDIYFVLYIKYISKSKKILITKNA